MFLKEITAQCLAAVSHLAGQANLGPGGMYTDVTAPIASKSTPICVDVVILWLLKPLRDEITD